MSTHYDVLVIGSGFGGSVSALRLTEKGYKVGVLEAGARLRDEDFAQHLAVDLHQEQLRREGWDTFWTDSELPYLTPH